MLTWKELRKKSAVRLTAVLSPEGTYTPISVSAWIHLSESRLQGVHKSRGVRRDARGSERAHAGARPTLGLIKHARP